VKQLHLALQSQGYALEEYHQIEDLTDTESRVHLQVATPDRRKLPICPNGSCIGEEKAMWSMYCHLLRPKGHPKVQMRWHCAQCRELAWCIDVDAMSA
jgi:hypothetical protein